MYCWQMSKLAHNFLNQQIFFSFVCEHLDLFPSNYIFFFHEQQICHFHHSPAGGLLEDD